MSKIRRISDLQHEFLFLNISENFDVYYNQFLTSDLGKIHTAIPWDDLLQFLKLKNQLKALRIILVQRESLH